MGKINLDEIKPGMSLAGDVLDRSGRILLKSGLEITEKHLKILKQWGVTDADIAGVNREELNAQAVQSLDTALVAEAESLVQGLFRHVDKNLSVVQELMRLSVLRQVHINTPGEADGK